MHSINNHLSIETGVRKRSSSNQSSSNQSGLDKLPSRHYDVIKWKLFPRYWPFARGIQRSPVNFPHKGQWRGALMFSLICAWMDGWVNNSEAGDLRRHRAFYDVTVMHKFGRQIGTLLSHQLTAFRPLHVDIHSFNHLLISTVYCPLNGCSEYFPFSGTAKINSAGRSSSF